VRKGETRRAEVREEREGVEVKREWRERENRRKIYKYVYIYICMYIHIYI